MKFKIAIMSSSPSSITVGVINTIPLPPASDFSITAEEDAIHAADEESERVKKWVPLHQIPQATGIEIFRPKPPKIIPPKVLRK